MPSNTGNTGKSQSYDVLPTPGDGNDGVRKGEFSTSRRDVIQELLAQGFSQKTVVGAYRAKKALEDNEITR